MKAPGKPKIVIVPTGTTYAVVVNGDHHETIDHGYFHTKAARLREARAIKKELLGK